MIKKILEFIGGWFFDIPDETLFYEESIGEEARPHWVKDNEDEYIEAMLNSEKVLTDD